MDMGDSLGAAHDRAGVARDRAERAWESSLEAHRRSMELHWAAATLFAEHARLEARAGNHRGAQRALGRASAARERAIKQAELSAGLEGSRTATG
jgi:hypothetical protein